MPVGNVNSTARGSGARYNDGKPDLSLIPPKLLPTCGHPEHVALHKALHVLVVGGDYADINRWFVASMASNSDACARVFEYGKIKYAAHNWMKGMAWSIPIACALRHASALWNTGEECDPESGLPHIGHVLANLVMLLFYIDYYPEGNDLPFCLLGNALDNQGNPTMTPLSFDEYQKWTETTAVYPTNTYPQLALAEEVGELLGKLAKYERDVAYASSFSDAERTEKYGQLRMDVRKEAGDVLWQLSRVLGDMGISLSSAAQGNVDKLLSRKERNVLGGSGDNR